MKNDCSNQMLVILLYITPCITFKNRLFGHEIYDSYSMLWHINIYFKALNHITNITNNEQGKERDFRIKLKTYGSYITQVCYTSPI